MRSFSRKLRIDWFSALSASSSSLSVAPAFIPTGTAYRLEPLTISGAVYLSPSLLTSTHSQVVQEYSPASHRLRFSASA